MAQSPRKSAAKASSAPKAGPHDSPESQATQPRKRSKPAAKPAESTKPAAKRKTQGGAAASKTKRGGSSTAEQRPSKPKAAGSSPAPRSTEPTPWQKWIADPKQAITELCEHVIAGGHMAELCKAKGLNYTSMLQWVGADDERRELYARAREDRSDRLADEIVAISDELDVTAKVGPDGEERLALDPTAVARNRLRVDARKWVAAKLKPRVYGDKVAVGGDPDAPPINHSLSVKFV